MKSVLVIIAALLLSATAVLALNGCAQKEVAPEQPVLQPHQLPLATDMILLDDEEERPNIAF